MEVRGFGGGSLCFSCGVDQSGYLGDLTDTDLAESGNVQKRIESDDEGVAWEVRPEKNLCPRMPESRGIWNEVCVSLRSTAAG